MERWKDKGKKKRAKVRFKRDSNAETSERPRTNLWGAIRGRERQYEKGVEQEQREGGKGVRQ